MIAVPTAGSCAGRYLRIAAIALCTTSGSVGAAAQESNSATAAKELVAAMAECKLETIAVQDPDAPDRFVAAMVFPDVQILMMAARSSSADYLRYQLGQKQYSDVYGALQSSAIPESRMFFHDLGSNGLQSTGETVDIMYERGTTQTVFDRNWKERGFSESTYQKKFREADEQYSRLLRMVLEAVRAQARAGGGGPS